MLRFLGGFILGFIGFLIFMKKEKEEKNINNPPFLENDTIKMLNIMKELQKAKERV